MALPKKMLLGALRFALSAKLCGREVDHRRWLAARIAKTQSLVSDARELSFTKSALLVSHGETENLELASRNLRKREVVGSERAAAL